MSYICFKYFVNSRKLQNKSNKSSEKQRIIEIWNTFSSDEEFTAGAEVEFCPKVFVLLVISYGLFSRYVLTTGFHHPIICQSNIVLHNITIITNNTTTTPRVLWPLENVNRFEEAGRGVGAPRGCRGVLTPNTRRDAGTNYTASGLKQRTLGVSVCVLGAWTR